MSTHHPYLAVALVSCLVGWLPCQRQVKQITKAEEAHFDAKISPDGKSVAFRGAQKIGVVGTSGGTETAVAQGANLGSFVWSPNSAGIYYLDGTTVKFVSKSGGNALSIGTGSGSLFLWGVDRADKTIYGTRSDNNNNYYVFSLPTSGSASPKDIVSITTNYWVEQVAVDFSGSKLAYFVSLQGVHKPKDLRVADADGKNEKSWSGGAKLASTTRNLAWSDAGKTVIFTTLVQQTSLTWQIGRLTAASTIPDYLTSEPMNHQRSVVGPNLSWIVCQAGVTVLNKNHQVPSVMPVDGGGRVILEPDNSWVFQGDPSIDGAGQKVAFAASYYDTNNKLTTAQVYLVELDREVVIRPRAAPGGKVSFSLPVDKGEQGMLFLSLKLLDQPFPVVGFTYGVAIDTNLMVQLLRGVGDGNSPLQLTDIPIPNDTNLKGVEVYVQGIRSPNGNTGDFTRYVELQVQ